MVEEIAGDVEVLKFFNASLNEFQEAVGKVDGAMGYADFTHGEPTGVENSTLDGSCLDLFVLSSL